MPSRGYKKPTEQRREKRVHALFTEAEFCQVQDLAEAAGLTVSAYLRSVALGRRPKAKPTRVASELVRELNRVGVNLNQLTRLAHEGKLPDEQTLESTLDEVLSLVRKVA